MKLKVVKIGTSLLRSKKGRPTAKIIDEYCYYLSKSINNGDKIVLVSSGAVGLGCQCIGMNKPPVDLVSLQAAAAIGQGKLMALYENSMRSYGFNVAQVLLTRSDFESRSRYKNASSTIKRILDLGVLPIINENDSLSPEELKYGDNDTLSALVATALDAEQLILLTDIDRLYSNDPRTNLEAKPITDIYNKNELIEILDTAGKPGTWGTGGISTKLEAARIATLSGIDVHLSDGRDPLILKNLLNGSRGGTVFHGSSNPIGNKKSWLAHALKPVGTIKLDEGACTALEDRGASLLLVGVKEVFGTFDANQPVKIVDPKGNEVAKGICSISSENLNRAMESAPEPNNSPIVVHRDVLVLTNDYF